MTTCTPASRHSRAFAERLVGLREVDDDVGVAEHVGRARRPSAGSARPLKLEVVGALDGGAHRLAHPPRGAGDGDPRHAASGSAAGQTPRDGVRERGLVGADAGGRERLGRPQLLDQRAQVVER